MAKQQRLYGKMQKLDIYKNIAQIEEEISDLRKGIIYLDGRLADVHSKEWAQNHEEWSVYKRANKNYMSVLHQKKEALHKELNTRLRIEANDAIQANAVAAHTPEPQIIATYSDPNPGGIPQSILNGWNTPEPEPERETLFILTRSQVTELFGVDPMLALGN